MLLHYSLTQEQLLVININNTSGSRNRQWTNIIPSYYLFLIIINTSKKSLNLKFIQQLSILKGTTRQILNPSTPQSHTDHHHKLSTAVVLTVMLLLLLYNYNSSSSNKRVFYPLPFLVFEQMAYYSGAIVVIVLNLHIIPFVVVAVVLL